MSLRIVSVASFAARIAKVDQDAVVVNVSSRFLPKSEK
jgi:hypothetical protein